MSPYSNAQDARLRNTYEDLTRNAEMYLKELDPRRGVGTLVPMTPANYNASSFLDRRIVTDSDMVFDLPLEVLLRMAPWFAGSRQALHFIFHIGHCGSTLLSRLIGGLPGFLALREPAPLRMLAEYALPGRPVPGGWDASLAVVLGLLSRVFDHRDTAVVKPSSFCNRLMPSLMGWHPACRGVLMYIELSAYLAAMAKKGARRETETAMTRYHLAEIRHLLDDDDFEPPSMSGLETASLVWLMNLVHFQAALGQADSRGRLKVVRFDDLLAEPVELLGDCAAFLGAQAPAHEIARVATDPAIVGTYSKGARQAYGTRERADELRRAHEAHGEEIEEAIRFAREISRRHPAFEAALSGFGGV